MKKIVYVDMDNVLVNFQSGIDRLDEEIVVEYEGRLDEVPGIFALMDPLHKAIESFIELANALDAYILSTSPWNNPTAASEKVLWVRKHLGDHARKRLILSHNKHLNHGEYLIDDRTARGADRFVGEHIHFGQDPHHDWDAVMAYLRAKEGF